MTYAITGSTGGLGSLIVKHVLDQGIPPKNILALARNQAKTDSLKNLGVTVRIADYNDPAGYEKALQGVDRLLLVSGSDVGQRLSQHQSVLQAAQKAGVKQVIYTSLAHADTSTNPLAPEHLGTEQALRASGLDWVILRNNWYTENYAGDLAGAKQSGTIVAAVKAGRVASALKIEYAEAAARVLTGEGHSKKVYELAGTPWSFPELAAAATQVLGREVSYKLITEEEKTALLKSFGLPEALAAFFASVDTTIDQGSLGSASGDLAGLLGRSPLDLVSALKTLTQ